MASNSIPRDSVIHQRFGLLYVVAVAETPQGKSGVYWHCHCDCGRPAIVYGSYLVRCISRSCGCLVRQAVTDRSRTHGLSDLPEYKTWVRMRGRCSNPRSPDYSLYGGRGVTVCAQWNDFAAFYADMGPRPSLGHSIDRIDPDGNYCPENCRWATATEQRRNQRFRLHPLTIHGETHLLADWAMKTGIPRNTISRRIKRGWTPEEAITVSPEGTGPKILSRWHRRHLPRNE